MMQRLDKDYMMRSSEPPLPKCKPGDYMREMYFTTQPMELTDMGCAGSGLPHNERRDSTALFLRLPAVDLASIIYDLPFLGEKAKPDILGGNRMRLFNLKLPAEKITQAARLDIPARTRGGRLPPRGGRRSRKESTEFRKAARWAA